MVAAMMAITDNPNHLQQPFSWVGQSPTRCIPPPVLKEVH